MRTLAVLINELANIENAIEDDGQFRCDANEILATIQDTIGQEDGGYAGMFFSGRVTDDWNTDSVLSRVHTLLNYVEQEVKRIACGIWEDENE
jgi:hypothetical protein